MRKSPIRRVAQVILTGCLIGALAMSGVNLWSLAQSPAGSAFVARSTAGIEAATQRALAQQATPEALGTRIGVLLDEEPRNWLAIDAVADLAADRAVGLPPALMQQLTEARAADHSYWQTTQKCASCAMDARTCALSAIMLCRAPVDLTVIGDVAGLSRGASNYLAGREVDQVDIILSAIGLASVALIVASGGTSTPVKAGASFAKMAKSMNRLPPAIIRPLMRAAREGVDWARLPAARSATDVSALLRPQVLRPATAILDDAGRMVRRTSTLDGLHLMKYVDDPADLSRMARAADALGPRTVGVVETLGKARILRLTMRVADRVWFAAAGMVAALAALLGLLETMILSTGLRGLRRLV